jgi:tetratricopeptide (TPR) repeat protein
VIFDDVADVEELAPRPGESVEAHRMRSEHAFVARLLRDRPHREVFYLGRPDGDLDAGQRLDPHGLLYRLRRADEPALDDAPLWASYREARVRRQAERSRDPFAQAIAATYPIARGEGRLAAGDRDGAFEALEEAAQLARRNSSAQNYIGTVFGSAGEYRRAIACFERAVALKPSAYLAWRNLGLAYQLAGDLAGARDAWRRMARLDAFRAEARAELQRLGDAS